MILKKNSFIASVGFMMLHHMPVYLAALIGLELSIAGAAGAIFEKKLLQAILPSFTDVTADLDKPKGEDCSKKKGGSGHRADAEGRILSDIGADNHVEWYGYDIPSNEDLEKMELRPLVYARLLQYNSLPKGDLDSMAKRVGILESFRYFLSDAPDNEKRFLDHVILIGLYLKHTFLSGHPKIVKKSPMLLDVIDDVRTVRCQTGEYIENGRYTLEQRDFFHRPLAPLYAKCCRILENKDITDTEFFLWLDREPPPTKVDHVYYLTDEERLTVTASVQNGLLCDVNGVPITQDGKFKFIIDHDFNIIISSFMGEILRHSSLSRCEAVFFSGHLQVCQGILVYLDNNSGHYMPNEAHVERALEKLKDLGLRFDPGLVVKILK